MPSPSQEGGGIRRLVGSQASLVEESRRYLLVAYIAASARRMVSSTLVVAGSSLATPMLTLTRSMRPLWWTSSATRELIRVKLRVDRRPGQPPRHDDELVAPEPSDQVPGPHAGDEPGRRWPG